MTNERERPHRVPAEREPAYLGDSVYAREQHGIVLLYTYNGIATTNKIFLEPEVFDALAKFAAEVFDR
jgi:hypothetical protein